MKSKPRGFDKHEAAGTRKIKGCPTRPGKLILSGCYESSVLIFFRLKFLKLFDSFDRRAFICAKSCHNWIPLCVNGITIFKFCSW
jgi:hypothetical protein